MRLGRRLERRLGRRGGGQRRHAARPREDDGRQAKVEELRNTRGPGYRLIAGRTPSGSVEGARPPLAPHSVATDMLRSVDAGSGWVCVPAQATGSIGPVAHPAHPVLPLAGASQGGWPQAEGIGVGRRLAADKRLAAGGCGWPAPLPAPPLQGARGTSSSSQLRLPIMMDPTCRDYRS